MAFMAYFDYLSSTTLRQLHVGPTTSMQYHRSPRAIDHLVHFTSAKPFRYVLLIRILGTVYYGFLDTAQWLRILEYTHTHEAIGLQN